MYDVWAQNLSPWWSNDRRELNGCLSWFGTGCWSCSKQCFYRLIQTCINNEETIFRNSTLQYIFWNTQSIASNVSLFIIFSWNVNNYSFWANKVSQAVLIDKTVYLLLLKVDEAYINFGIFTVFFWQRTVWSFSARAIIIRNDFLQTYKRYIPVHVRTNEFGK